MDEFDLITRYFRPLAKDFPGSLELGDDAAVVGIPAGHELVITKDAISAGVHFMGDETPDLIARKLLRVNLSDLTAMGAKPLCYFLALMLPASTNETWIESFTTGLRQDQNEFGIHLAGGDTTATKGPLALSVTALGIIPSSKALRRSSAKPGDMIYVSGTLGDSAMGLKSLQQKQNKTALERRYLLPEPRVALGQQLVGIAHSCMDISDGLAQDLGHICTAAGVGAIIHRDKLPLSVSPSETVWEAALSGGDDYELLFTIPPEKEKVIEKLATELSLQLTAIGKIVDGNNVQVLDENGHAVALQHKGYRHF